MSNENIFAPLLLCAFALSVILSQRLALCSAQSDNRAKARYGYRCISEINAVATRL